MSEAQSVFAPSPYFSSVLYTIEKPEFLPGALEASDASLGAAESAMPMNATYPFVMSGSLSGLPQTKDLEQFIAQAAWAILDNQGYDMAQFNTIVSEFWAQKHMKFSGMEQHVHPHGVVLSGFYFLECPEGGSMVELHDPRAGKVQASLPMKDQSIVRECNNSIFIKPQPGLVLMTNSWLPHSFTRNSSDEPVKFIHFNISVLQAQTNPPIVV